MTDSSLDPGNGRRKSEQAHGSLSHNGEIFMRGEHSANWGASDDISGNATDSKRKARRKEDSPLDIVCSWIVEHQIGLAVNLLVLLVLTHACFPRARRHTRKFFGLSYYNPKTGEYCAGWNDAWMVLYWIIVFTGLRAAVMDYALLPLARKWGVKIEKDKIKFAEQAWLLIYYSVFWTLGMYIWVNSEYWLNLKELWTNWPNREIGGLIKWYILVQYAFWIQQMMVIKIEQRRKDHWKMFTHHIVTNMLIFTSYGYHQTKVANIILCIMDVVDLFLPVAKCLKYLGYSISCDVVFGIFMISWVAARHIMYLLVCWSVYADTPSVIAYGCYRGRNGVISGPLPSPKKFGYLFEPFHDPEGVVCWNNGIKWGFLSTLLFLQGITIMWFWMIVQVALQVLEGTPTDDTRSDNEEEDEEPEEVCEKLSGTFTEKIHLLRRVELPPLEEEVGVEKINLKGRHLGASKVRYKKPVGSASGVSIPSDRKDLLGRIGCDKGA